MSLSPYLRRIRSHVGSALVLLPAASVLIADDEDRLLLVRQSHSGRWGTVGGAIEPGESPQVAAVREANEETGLTIRVDRLVAALGGEDFHVTYSNGDQVQYLSIVFEGSVIEGTPTPDGEEILELGWFSREELPALDINPLSASLLRQVGWLPEA
jgi:8-oxo-dGTP pyrophosphatase MutT (NUDIX family)